jgi:hypothetical protein
MVLGKQQVMSMFALNSMGEALAQIILAIQELEKQHR